MFYNCTQYEKYELDKIQNEAARIATGATKLVSLTNLYKEIGWESLSKRRSNHKLTLLYKMINHLTPIYLSSLIPAQVSSASRYNLRNAQNYQTIRARTNQYRDSFLPSTLHLWNNLPLEARQSNTLNSFKLFLKKGILPIPRYYYHGNRKPQILHSRLRTGCSALNLDLFTKFVLGVHSKASNFAVLSELGQYPLVLSALVSCMNFWLHFVQSNDNSLVNKAYREQCNNSNSQWLSFVKRTFM